MKTALRLAWIIFGIILAWRAGLFLWRYETGYGDVVHINEYLVVLVILILLSVVQKRKGALKI